MRRDWNHNIQYHRLVVTTVPSQCASALDVGCGEGVLTRELARRAEKVTGLDLEPQIIAVAEKEPLPRNVSFVTGDFLTHPFPPGGFAFICAVATLHHLPLKPALSRFVELLAPGGVLTIIGLYQSRSLADKAYDVLGFLVSQITRRFCCFEAVNAPTQEPQQTLDEIRIAAERLLPGSTVRRRLLFRYSLVWRKPSVADHSS